MIEDRKSINLNTNIVRNIVFKILSVILMFLLVKSPKDYILYGGLTILSSVGSNIFNIINIRYFVKFSNS